MRYKSTRYAFTLFEVLIALIVLATGMLGIAHLLLLSHKSNSSNYIRQQAVQSAYNILDRITANRDVALSGAYSVSNLVSSGAPTVPSGPTTNCVTSTCSATQLASYDTWFWLAQDLTQLPNGCGSITTAGAGLNTLVTVTVQWDNSPAQTMQGIINPTPTQLIIQGQL